MDTHTREALRALIEGCPAWREPLRRQELIAEVERRIDAASLTRPISADPTVDAFIEQCHALSGGRAEVVAAALSADLYAIGLADQRPVNRTEPAWGGTPFPGTRPLDLAEDTLLLGRAAELRELMVSLLGVDARSLLIIAGATGSGRTSMLRAGIWKSLRASVPGDVVSFLRGSCEDPVADLLSGLGEAGVPLADTEGLATALRQDSSQVGDLIRQVSAGSDPQARWWLLLDDLDCLLAMPPGSPGEGLARGLLAAAQAGTLRVVAALRLEALIDSARHEIFRRAVNEGALHVISMPGRDALRRMIRGPSLLPLEPAIDVSASLSDKLVDLAMERTRDRLPLLAFVLAELARRARAQGSAALVDEDLDQGFDGFIERHAERALDGLDEARRAALPRLFSRLVDEPSERVSGIRRQPLAAWEHDPAALALLRALATPECHLIEIEGQHARLAGEFLLAGWPSLAAWSERRADANKLARRVRSAAERWQRLGHQDLNRWPHEVLMPARDQLRDADLLDGLEQDATLADFLTPEAECLLAEIMCLRTDDGRREDIGLRLSEIGDPRLGVGVVDGVPSIEWCRVPGGDVKIDGQREFTVAAFDMAAYPVTQAQFVSFLVAEDGFSSDAWWDGLGRYEPVFGRLRRRGNYPATLVSWYDAVAFCRWLSARLERSVRLPDEWEWQWAAQSGKLDFVYPWGPDWQEGLANTDEAGIGRATAVGMYPGGRTLQGVNDLAGNTWEWCRNEFSAAIGRQAFGGGTRVIRGGSWRVNRGFSRADFRLDASPEDRVGGTSFRVVCEL